MSDSIFLVGDDGSLIEARSAAYIVEAELQKLLADNIHLPPGAQISPDNPRRWKNTLQFADTWVRLTAVGLKEPAGASTRDPADAAGRSRVRGR